MKTAATLIALVAGIVIGAGAGVWLTGYTTGPAGEDARFGPWSTTTSVGEENQSPYSRARVAIHGIWGLPPSEVIYFTARHDQDGDLLDPRCTYLVNGQKLPTRWWSVTLYEDGFYIDNPANRYSWSASDVVYDPPGDPDGRWILEVSPDGDGPNKLAFGPGDGKRVLLLRLYQPDAGVADNRGTVPLPTIVKQSCA